MSLCSMDRSGEGMNANELADGILAIEERIFLTKKEHQLLQNSATMLRQQQSEIDDLKAKLQLHEAMDNQCASLMQQFRKAQEK